MATDRILGFLQFGDDPSFFDTLPTSSLSPFLPSLAVLSSVSPSLTSHLLAPLVSHPQCPTALSYASLDFSSISSDVQRMEEEEEMNRARAREKSRAGGAEEVSVEGSYSGNGVNINSFSLLSGGMSSSSPPASSSAQAFRMDESLQFERADEKKRVEIAILSLRRQALKFYGSIEVGMKLEKLWFQLQDDAGSIWNNAIYFPELCCLLPIAVFLCPAVLLPEHIIWGLLPTNGGFMLLAAVLLNNPVLMKDSFSLLSEFLLSHHDASVVLELDNMTMDMKSGSSWGCSITPGDAQFRINSLRHMQSNQLDNLYVNHCINQALLTMLYLSAQSNLVAHMCRELLTKHCIFAGVIIYLTIEHLHDELDFMSKVIFSDKKTSEWMLSYLGSAKVDSYLEDMLKTIEMAEPMNNFGLRDFERKAECTNVSYTLKSSGHHLREALLSDAQFIKEKYGWCGQLHGHLRLYCVLIRAAELQPTHQEIDFWLKSFGSITYEETLHLAISFFCLVPGLSTSTSRSLYQKSVSTILSWEVNSEARLNSAVEELALWFAVQLFLRQFSEIAVGVREVLGVHLTIQNALIQELHDAAIAVEIISEPSSLLKAVAALRPKGPISTRVKSTHLLKCLDQLLSSGHFSRNGVDVSETLSHCISISINPIHPLLIQVIQVYVDAPTVILQGKAESRTFRMPILPRSFLEASFVTNLFLISNGNGEKELVSGSTTIVREALVSYYMLYREKCLQNAGVESFTETSLRSFFNQEKCRGNWWTELLLRIPFKPLMNHMENNWPDFEHLFPKWLSLAAGLFPEMFNVRDLLEGLMDSNCVTKGFSAIDGMQLITTTDEHEGYISEGDNQSIQSSALGKVLEMDLVLSIPFAKRAIQNALKNPLPSLQILNILCVKSNSNAAGNFAEYETLIMQNLVPKLLDRQCMRCLQEKFCTWFKSLQPLSKQRVFPTFIEAILDTSQMKTDTETLVVMAQVKNLILELGTKIGKYTDLVQQPLILLACKLQVYRTPLLHLILEILSELLIVNRRVCVVVTSDVAAREQLLKSEEVSSALMAQDSAVCQILLEACMPNTAIDDDDNVASLLETRKAICEFLSGFLEQNHLLLKLIHFQGYNPRLIPMMIDGVPAMVKCFAFLPELLQQQQQSKQVFGIILIAKIACAHVDLPESYSAIEKAIAHVKHVKNNICSSSNFMQGVLGVMAQVACAFPSVRADIIDILQSCMKSSGPLKHDGYPRDPLLHRATLSAFEHIVKKKFLYGRLSHSVMPVY